MFNQRWTQVSDPDSLTPKAMFLFVSILFSTILDIRRPWYPFQHPSLPFFVTPIMIVTSQLRIQGCCYYLLLLRSTCSCLQVNAWPSSLKVRPLEPNQNRSCVASLVFTMTSLENMCNPGLQITYPASVFWGWCFKNILYSSLRKNDVITQRDDL